MKTLLANFTEVLHRSNEENQLETTLKLNVQHEVFKGHFPEMPVLPGVLITQLFKEEVAFYLQKQLLIGEVKQIKFLKVINPTESEEVTLKITLNLEENISLKGEMIHQNQTAAKVRLTLKQS
ncbi:hydroxymyristoyl-ACP dehydratase [Mesonia sp. K7]|uniref:hydroxymyristoyl-ACP dehydratase n=1 Tax=Mesonia sp. K7 TaxID=2218606 RepID=UPI000DA85BFA|nr:hydroxymyristoyl-ACP dehydratase [Mesonia sp. K7]PZD76832.1 hydroxymyristoyl-ACP dehydratase [Mesonia sp. K7]